jgi:hypothetical protein
VQQLGEFQLGAPVAGGGREPEQPRGLGGIAPDALGAGGEDPAEVERRRRVPGPGRAPVPAGAASLASLGRAPAS